MPTSFYSYPTRYFTRMRARQSGVATLLTSVVILLLASVLIIGVSKTSLMELRISGNEIRARTAAAAAEAGLSFGLAYVTRTTIAGLTVPSGSDKDKNDVADTIALTTVTTGTQNSFSLRFCDPTQALANVSCPDAPGAVVCTAAPAAPVSYLRTPRLVACGWSDDGLGRAMISQNVSTVPGLAKGPTNPLTAKGTVNVQGSATVTNYYNNLTIWSGGSLDNIGNAGKSFVRNPTVAPPSSSTVPPAPPNSCSSSADYVCNTNKNATGPDVIDVDPTLSNLNNAQMFTNYFGVADINAYKSTVASLVMDPANVSTLNGAKSETIVVTGDLTSNMNFTIGSREQPVVLIIDGNWSGGGNTTIYGVVYVTGNVALTGNKTIYGAAVLQGNVSGTGSLDIIYDPQAVDGAANRAGKAGSIPGSWRDWR